MFRKKQYKNGLRLLTIPNKAVESVTVIVFVKTGGRYEPIEKSGLSHYVEHTIFKGTQKRPRMQDIAVEIEQVGGMHNAATSHEFTYYYVKVPMDKIEVAFDILSDTLFNSEFKKEYLELERQVILEEINVYNDSPIDKVGDYFLTLLWPNHPLGSELTGTKEQFLSITRQDILDYMDTYYYPNNMLLTVSGNVKESLAERLTEQYFMKQSKKNIPTFDKVVEKQTKPEIDLHYKETDQTHFFLGVRSLPANHPDRYILEVLTAVLGKGMSSRLFETVREKNGLCYYITAGMETFSDTGAWFVRAGVDNKRFIKALDLIMKELKKIKTARVPKKELKKTKEYMKGKLKLSLETSDAQATFFGLQELMLEEALTTEELCAKIDEVTNDDIMRLANELFVNERLNLAAITPEKDIAAIKKVVTF